MIILVIIGIFWSKMDMLNLMITIGIWNLDGKSFWMSQWLVEMIRQGVTAKIRPPIFMKKIENKKKMWISRGISLHTGKFNYNVDGKRGLILAGTHRKIAKQRWENEWQAWKMPGLETEI